MSEHDEQVKLFEWAAYMQNQIHELSMMFAIPNGGLRLPRTAAILKREGVKAGVPDVFLPVPKGEFHGLWIEMKFGNNKPTKSQRQWLQDLDGLGYATIVCWSFEGARDVILDYLGYDV